ncbi:MAG: OmpP1/FadL family transporter [Magnetospirillum sp.]
MFKPTVPAWAGRFLIAPWALVAADAAPAWATNGYFSNGYGAPSKAMAGSGVAMGEGPLASAQNPALGSSVGNVAGLCFTSFMPHRDVTNEGTGGLKNGSFESENEFFEIVCGGANYMVDDKTSVGLLMFGNGGMNTEYKDNVFVPGFGSGTSPLGVDLAQAFFSFNVAHKFDNNVSLGFAPVLAVQRFKAYGLEMFSGASTDSAHLTGNGYDWSTGGGFKLGATWDATPWLSLGVAYQSRMWMSKLDKYSGLFAEQGDFDIPSFINEGIAIKPHRDWAVTLEHQRIFYEDVASLSNSHARSSGALRLGSDDGGGFGWNNMDIYRLGVQWQADPALTLRAGISHANSFTDGQEVLFNILAPATPTTHVGVGATWHLDEKWSLTGSFAHAFSHELSGSNPAMNANQTTKLRMDQDELAIGFSYKF